jgi:hypothetical protein
MSRTFFASVYPDTARVCGGGSAGGRYRTSKALDRFRICAIDDQNETDFIDYNTAFHRAIEDLAGNARMAAIARDRDEQFARLVRISLRAFKYLQVRVACSEHEAILAALQDHDADRASRLAYEDLASGHSRIAGSRRGKGSQPDGGGSVVEHDARRSWRYRLLVDIIRRIGPPDFSTTYWQGRRLDIFVITAL